MLNVRTLLPILVILLFLINGSPAVFATEVYFDITASQARRIDIALPYFTCSTEGEDALLQEIHKTFTQDLEFSGRFNVVDISRFFSGGSTEIVNPDFRAWYLVGIQTLLTGHVIRTETDVEVNVRLFDIQMGQQIVGVRYKSPLSEVRAVVHKFADEVQFRLTGERGINYTQIAFTSNHTGNKEVYNVDTDGGNLTQLTRNGSINISPCWAPDNTRIALTSFKDGHPDLFTLDPKSRVFSPIIQGGMNITPVFSPDGDKIAFSKSFDGDPEIVIYDLARKKQRRITFAPGVDTNPTFAPNGRELAFVSDRSGSPQIYVMDIDGTNVRRLTRVGNYNTSPDWSPRGDLIAYHSRREYVFNIWLIRPDGSDEHPVTSEAGHNEDPTWARDGRHLAFISTRKGGKGLYVMDLSGRAIRPVLVHHGSCENPSWSR